MNACSKIRTTSLVRPPDFDALVLANTTFIRSWLLKRLRDRELADDLTQSVALKALKYWRQFTPGTNFQAWLFRIATNEMGSHFRINKRRPTESLDVSKVEKIHVQNADQDIKIEVKELVAAMALLHQTQRAAVAYICVAGFSYIEAARLMGVSEGTVKSRLWRARAKLARMMGVELGTR